ncbi:MAG: Transcriptional regulator, LysR family, partial [Rhizobacter sp.]|nr:Transcriptional regulator, LysR family [Rhizobacter sp.]
VLVRELENGLGVRLLDRHTRRVELSEAGRDFHVFVQRVLRDLDDAVQSVSSLRDKRKGLLRVAAPQLMACTLMPQVIAGYQKLFPQVEVKLIDTLPEQMLERVLNTEVELAVGPDAPAGNTLVRRPLFRDRHHLICQPDHPLAARKKVRWKDVARHPFIAPTRDFMRRLGPELAEAEQGESLIVPVHEVSYMTTALGMVAAGLGVTACPSYSGPLVRAYGLAMREVADPVFYREVCIYQSPVKSLSPAARSFVEHLEAFVASQMPELAA